MVIYNNGRRLENWELSMYREEVTPAMKKMEKAQKARERRKAREEAYRSCGLVKVKGALGGTYWE